MTGIQDLAKIKLPDPNTFKYAENTSTFKLQDAIKSYLEVIGGQYGGLYLGIRNSAMGMALYGSCGPDAVAWGGNPQIDGDMFGWLKGIDWGFIADPAVRPANVSKFIQ